MVVPLDLHCIYALRASHPAPKQQSKLWTAGNTMKILTQELPHKN